MMMVVMMANKMKDIYDLAEKIKDASLKKKTLSLIKNPKLANSFFNAKPSRFENAPGSLNWHHAFEGGLLEHTVAITKMAMKTADVLRSVYGIEINKDVLISGCLLHDIGKVFEYSKESGEWDANDLLLDHTMLGTAELYARGFPQEVIHMVASHFGDKGPTPPMTIEAKILSNIDLFDAETESAVTEAAEDEAMSLLDIIKEAKGE